jgi:maltooligosyltrehalose trehalohydrolase
VELIQRGQKARRMSKDQDGWYQSLSASAHAGTRYQFRINGDLLVPDPASPFQPDDVDQPSEVFAPASLRDAAPYAGRPWEETVIYELHVGTFSEEGSYAGVEKRLRRLRDLGITAIELMPLNDVPGRHNWGYDGVLLNAPNARYGRPEDLKRLISVAHDLDMMVYLDVVYNHFGAHSNYLHSYAENFFTDRHTTGWGPAVNLEGKAGGFVRQFLVDNALMWLRDYGFDGLRLDAVHTLKDDSDKHFLVELAETVRHKLGDRQVHLMLENEANKARLLERTHGHTPLYDAQWSDDFHNALHVLLTGENEGYYSAFADKPLEHLTRALTEGFAYQGEIFPLHDKPRGEPSAQLPPEATIFFAQNHDQIGNRALGERLSKLVSFDKMKQAMSLILLSPHIPMLFMGEEAAAETPFLFFADWQGGGADVTREGRRKEFAHFKSFSTPEMRDKIPDPCDEKTYQASRLDWATIDHAPRAREFRAFTKELLQIRRDKIIPLIKEGFVEAASGLLNRRYSQAGVAVEWRTRTGAVLQIVTNFSDENVAIPSLADAETVWPPTTNDNDFGNILRPAQTVVRRSLRGPIVR